MRATFIMRNMGAMCGMRTMYDMPYTILRFDR